MIMICLICFALFLSLCFSLSAFIIVQLELFQFGFWFFFSCFEIDLFCAMERMRAKISTYKFVVSAKKSKSHAATFQNAIYIYKRTYKRDTLYLLSHIYCTVILVVGILFVTNVFVCCFICHSMTVHATTTYFSCAAPVCQIYAHMYKYLYNMYYISNVCLRACLYVPYTPIPTQSIKAS